jgi:hypothetical protein
LGALIVAMVAIVPASADAPSHTKLRYQQDFPMNYCGVEMQAHMDVKTNEFLYFDRYGGDRAYAIHWGGSTFYMTYNGRTLTMHVSDTERTDWITWYDAIITIRGAQLVGTLPGHGIVVGIIGRQEILETCHDEGNDWVCDYQLLHISGLNFIDEPAVCDYFLNGN